MKKMFYYDTNGRPHANLGELVENYLSDNHVVLCKRQYYIYNPATGLWCPQTIEEIQLDAARYFQANTELDWHYSYKKEVTEKLKVEISSIEEMDCASETAVCMLNGVYDLADDSFGKHSPDYYFTTGLQIKYTPNAKCEKFIKFLKQLSCKKKNRRKSLEEFLGLALTKSLNSRGFVMIGTGRNGKSVFANIACALAGKDRWTSLSLKEMPNYGSAVLQDKTLAVISEIDKKTSNSLMINELKQALSGENMQVNRKYHDLFNMRCRATILILTNHTIGFEFDDTDGALRRFHIFPAEYQVKEDDVDVDLEKHLLEELEGIFLLAANGYRRLQANNFEYSSKKESDQLIASILERENPLRAFVKGAIEMCANHFIAYSELRQRFIEWCESKGIEYSDVSVDSKKICLEVSKQFNIKTHKSNGKRGLLNIRFKE